MTYLRVHVTLPVTAIVLAGGLSRRMGAINKLLAPLHGLPMVRHVVNEILASDCQRVVVVLGHEGQQVRQALADLSVDFIINPNHHEGLGASVRTGASLVEPGHGALVCLGDMPFVSSATINALIAAYQRDNQAVAYQPVFEGRRGNPVLWSAAHVSRLQTLAGDEGARQLLALYREDVTDVNVEGRGILTDIDTPYDLERTRNDGGTK